MRGFPTSEVCVRIFLNGFENPVTNKGCLQLIELCMNHNLNN